MSEIINLKQPQLPPKPASSRFRWGREVVVVLVALSITVGGLKAADNFWRKQEEEPKACPKEMVFVPSAEGGFCIDKFEASPAPTCPFASPDNQAQTRENLNHPACRPISRAGLVPWRFISQNQAAAACAKAGKRLPTNKEWLQASLGTLDKIKDWKEDDCQVKSNWSQQPGLTGSGKNCVSSFGVYDMIGNVWEWVDNTITNGVYKGRKLPQAGFIFGVDEEGVAIGTNPQTPDENYNNDYFWIKTKGVRAFARGGYWDNGAEAGLYSVYLVSPPQAAEAGIGFRCVK